LHAGSAGIADVWACEKCFVVIGWAVKDHQEDNSLAAVLNHLGKLARSDEWLLHSHSGFYVSSTSQREKERNET
jgi:hypothetical protein